MACFPYLLPYLHTMSFPPGGSVGSGLPGGYPIGYDGYSSPPPPQQLPSSRYPPPNATTYPPPAHQRVDAYGRVFAAVPPPPPPPGPPPPPPQQQQYQIPPSMYPTSAPSAGYNIYHRQAAFSPQQMYPAAPTFYQPHLSSLAGGYATLPPPPPPPNPYTGMPAYVYPQSAPPLAGHYPGSNPYDPYGTAYNAAMARSYQEGFDSRDRGRHRGELMLRAP